MLNLISSLSYNAPFSKTGPEKDERINKAFGNNKAACKMNKTEKPREEACIQQGG